MKCRRKHGIRETVIMVFENLSTHFPFIQNSFFFLGTAVIHAWIHYLFFQMPWYFPGNFNHNLRKDKGKKVLFYKFEKEKRSDMGVRNCIIWHLQNFVWFIRLVLNGVKKINDGSTLNNDVGTNTHSWRLCNSNNSFHSILYSLFIWKIYSIPQSFLRWHWLSK